MLEILNYVEERIRELEKVVDDKKNAIAHAPDGVLAICKNKNKTQFYQKLTEYDKEGKRKVVRKYIKNSEKDFAKILCQKEYDKNVLIAAEKELMLLNKLKSAYPNILPEQIYETLREEKKNLSQPFYLPDDLYISQWQKQSYERKAMGNDVAEFYTEKGERVRSKSEILIANALNKHNVPYHYEKPLYLNGYGWIHPDFTVLNVRKRKEMFWEHLGKMGDEKYADDNIRRLASYEKNGFFVGDNLLLTFETGKCPLSSLSIESVIRNFLL